MSQFDVFIEGLDFGEGPRWHDGRLWYSDFYHGAVYAAGDDGVPERIVAVPTRPSGLGWTPDGTLLIVSMTDQKVLAWDGSTLSEHADLSGVAVNKCNDMVVDKDGRAYVGNFGFDLEAGESPVTTQLAIVEPDGAVRAGPGGLHFPNGMVITPDDRTLIVGESFGGQYTAYSIADNGDLGDPRIWASIPGTAPDGCTLDADGGIWFADALGAQLIRVVEGGEVTHTLPTGAPTFACVLGGADGKTLFALTAVDSHPDKAAGSGSGTILSTRVDVPRAGRP